MDWEFQTSSAVSNEKPRKELPPVDTVRAALRTSPSRFTRGVTVVIDGFDTLGQRRVVYLQDQSFGVAKQKAYRQNQLLEEAGRRNCVELDEEI